MAEYVSAKTGEYPSAFFFSARERTEFSKSYKLTASESGRNFPIRSAHASGIRRVELFS